ncbi:MAG: uroporphyrinogen decarboxylase family protein [Omnitrophica WOR_2 bacterium]
MKPVDRVRLALSHQEPDRVPTALWGGPYGIVDDLYFKLVEGFGLGQPIAPFRSGHTISYIDDRVLERLGTDTRYVWPGDSPSSPVRPTGQPGRFLDGYGQPWEFREPYYYATDPLLAGATLDDLDRRLSFPDPNDPRWTHGVRRRAQALKEGTDYFVIARMVTSHGPYMTSANLRGSEQFFVDMGNDPQFVTALVERVTDLQVAFLKNYLAACGPYIDMIELPGDDYATSTGLAFSPGMFRRYFKPALKSLVDTVKNYRQELLVMAHCDGLLERLLPDLIDVGVNVIHPLEPLPGADLDRVKASYGDRLSFLGAIDIVSALPGSREDVIAEVKTRIRQLAPGGGYILAPANHVQRDVPVENLVTLFEAARQYGTYPLTQVEG